MTVSFEFRDISVDLSRIVYSDGKRDVGQAKVFERATLNPIPISIDKYKKTFIARRGEEILGRMQYLRGEGGVFQISFLDSYKNKTYKNIGSALVTAAIEYYIHKGFPGAFTAIEVYPQAYEFYRKLKFRPIFPNSTREENKQLKQIRDKEYADINNRYLTEEGKIRQREDLDEHQRSKLLRKCLKQFAMEKEGYGVYRDMELPKKHIERVKNEISKNPILNITKITPQALKDVVPEIKPD